MALKLVDIDSTFEFIVEDDQESINPTIFVIRRESAKEVNKWATELLSATKGKKGGSLHTGKIDPEKLDAVEVRHFIAVVQEIKNIIDAETDELIPSITDPEKIREVAHTLPADARTSVISAAGEASIITGEDRKK